MGKLADSFNNFYNIAVKPLKTKLDGIASGATANSAYTGTPAMDGTGSAGSSANYARGDHVHPVDTSRAAASHNHAASDITSGTLGVARGGTGRSTLTSGSFLKGNGTSAVTLRTAAQTLYDIINGSTALTNSTIAADDYFALLDASGSTGAKITLANLLAYLQSNISAGAKTYVYTFTAANWSSGTLTIAAATHGITGSGIVATFYHNLSGTYTAGTWACVESWAYIDPSTHVITLHGPTDGYAGKVVLIG